MPYEFTPRPLRFRVWDGGMMRHPDGSDTFCGKGVSPSVTRDRAFMLTPDGTARFGIWDRGTVNGVPEAEDSVFWLYRDEPQQGAWMQSTGLHDADGVEVFEGDLVLLSSAVHPAAVCFGDYEEDNDAGGQDFHTGWFTESVGPHRIRWALRDDIAGGGRVVGNVFEHPRLIP